MARSRKAKKSKLKTILGVCAALAAAELAFIFYFQDNSKPKDVKEAIEESLSKQVGLTPKAKEQLKIQMAISHYQAEKGQLPTNLVDLVPTYFTQVPIDPETSKPFAYVVEKGRFYVGERSKYSSVVASNQQTGSKAVTTEEQSALEQEALIASLDEGFTLVSFVYDPKGKRDPFRPYDATPNNARKGDGLAGYDIGQLRLTAVVDNIVTIEDQSGKGFIARKGTKIGLNNGEIVEILPDRIKILETTTDFTGKQNTNVIEMELRNKAQKPE